MKKGYNVLFDLRYLIEKRDKEDYLQVVGFIKKYCSLVLENSSFNLFFYCTKKEDGGKYIKEILSEQYVNIEMYDEKACLEGFDIWLSIGMEVPPTIKKSPLISKYVILYDVEKKIKGQRIYNKSVNKVEYGLDYIKEYDYIIMNNGLEKAGLLSFYSDVNEKQVICEREEDFGSINKILEIFLLIEEKKYNQPLITIVTITYNLIKAGREKLVKQCFESVHNQTYHNHIEHIVIDGASTDGTIDILKNYQEKGYIKFFSEPDAGLYDAMNKGIEKASGKYIAFLNSDDFYHDINGVEYTIKIMERDELDYCYSNAIILNEDNSVFMWEANINNLPFATHYCHQTMFVKTEVMKELGGFNLKYKVSADSDIMIRIYSNNYIGRKLDYFFVTYRGGGISASQAEIARKDHSNTFFENIGCRIGLTQSDCEELWQYKFFDEMFLDQQIRLLSKTGSVFNVDGLWIQVFDRIRLTTRIKNKLIEKRYIVNHRKKFQNRVANIYFLFDKVPFFMTIHKG